MNKSTFAAGFAAAALLAMIGMPASAATFNEQNGFGSQSNNTFGSCDGATVSAGFATSTVLNSGDFSSTDCVGNFSVSIDTATQTITLTGLEYGNYEEGFLEITGISEVVISSLSTLSYVGLFDPNFYGDPATYGAIPVPQLSFTGSSIKILFSAYQGAPPQFTYARDGQAVFSYNSSAAVPEPGAWALMILGFGAAGSALRRRRMVMARA